MTGLTPRQSQVLGLFQASIREKGHAPSYREIAASLGHKSPSCAYNMITQLVRRGYLKQNPGLHGRKGSRSLVLVFGADAAPDWQGIALSLMEEARVMRGRLEARGIPAPPKSVDY